MAENISYLPEYKMAIETLHQILCDYGDPHMAIVVQQGSAEIYSQEAGEVFEVPG